MTPFAVYILSFLFGFLTISAATLPLTKSEIGQKKILVMLPVGVPSHHNVFSALTDELLNRGHFLTIVSPREQRRKHPRLREVAVKDPLEAVFKNLTRTFFQNNKSLLRDMLLIGHIGSTISGTVLENPEALALKEETFDLVITETWFFQEALLGFAHHFGCPSMTLNPFGNSHHINHFTGGSTNPSFVPNLFTTSGKPESFLERLQNTFSSALWMLSYQFTYYPKAEAQLRKAFPNAPPLEELVKNMTLTLINNNNALTHPIPLSPTVIEVGGLHIKPGKPLPADLKNWIEESKDGIVYFSLGSNLRANLLPEEKQKAIFASFGKLKQRVLVKWNDGIPAGAPDNCRFEEWVPQQEVLAHPNLKVFVTHGGLLSTQESVYYGAALIGMPIYNDQYLNMDMAKELGFAVQVSIFDLTTDALDAALKEVINNPRFRERSKELSVRFRLDPIKPLDKAVYYTEQLIKLGSFKHLQPSSVNLHWYQYTLLDVVAVICIALYAIYRIIRCACRKCLGMCCKTIKAKKD